jgi:hypothetical protein
MFESNMRTVSYFGILNYSFPSQIKISNNTNGMSVLLYDIFNIMQNYVIALKLGQGENFVLSVFHSLLNFQLGLGAAPLRECFVEVLHTSLLTAFHLNSL